MTTLHDRLVDLAADAPAGQAEPDLWDRGRRLVRRRRGTQVIAGATVALVAALGIGWWQQSPGPVAPASAEAELRLPDRFYEPSGWLPGTKESGPIGPLVAVIGAERSSWTGTEYGVVGVSGETGDYRFIDLPSDAVTISGDPGVALSPEGRYLAYWTSTTTVEGFGPVVEGIAIYDTVTGAIADHDFNSRWGVEPEGMAWTDGVLWFQAYRHTDEERASSRALAPMQWIASSVTWREAPFTPDFYEASTYAGDILTSLWRRSALLSHDGTRPSEVRFDLPVEHMVLGPGGRVAGDLDIDGPNAFDGRATALVTGTLDGGSADLVRVPGVKTHQVIGWRDERTVVIRRFIDRNATDVPFLAVDIRTGETTELAANEAGADWLIRPLVAADGWAAPTYDAPEPPAPWDPRVVLGGGVAVILAGGVAVLRWRRRVRP